jgi:hypothetical protein
MAQPQNISHDHHYVPRLLLKRFTDNDGNLWVYDALLRRKFKTGPSRAGQETDFYALDGQHPPDSIEKFLAQAVDGPGADAIEGLINGEHLTSSRIMGFMFFVAAQLQRTPNAFQRLSDVLSPIFKEMCLRMVRFDQDFRQSLSKSLSENGSSADDIREFFQFLERGEFKVGPSLELVLVQSLKLIDGLGVELSKMNWKFADLDSNDADLILGDHPVILEDSGPPEIPPRPLGIRNPYLQILMPFHPRKVALGSWEGVPCYGSLRPGAAAEIYELTLGHAHRFVYTSRDSDQILEQAVRLRGSGPRVNVQHWKRGATLEIRTEYK